MRVRCARIIRAYAKAQQLRGVCIMQRKCVVLEHVRIDMRQRFQEILFGLVTRVIGACHLRAHHRSEANLVVVEFVRAAVAIAASETAYAFFTRVELHCDRMLTCVARDLPLQLLQLLGLHRRAATCC